MRGVEVVVLGVLLAARAAWGAYAHSDEALFLSEFSTVNNGYLPRYPTGLAEQCAQKGTAANSGGTVTVSAATVTSEQVQSTCGTSSVCVIGPDTNVLMNSNLNVWALEIQGRLFWNTSTQTQAEQWLCAGYVVVTGEGQLQMNMEDLDAWIYIKDNSANHSVLTVRAFGGCCGTNDGPIINITGRPLARTWSLLALPVNAGDTNISLIHDPVKMGWQVGDRIAIASTTSGSDSENFTISAMTSIPPRIYFSLGQNCSKSFSGKAVTSPHAYSSNDFGITAAEVINLDRNVRITGDDFKHIDGFTYNGGSCFITTGCMICPNNPSRTKCTMGLHTQMTSGVMRLQYTRIDKCGQRGIRGKYCLHLHLLDKCPDCLFRGNAIESSMQRGIVIHGTHLSTVDHNVLYDVRGSGIFIEDGNEMYNFVRYNVAICPWRNGDSTPKKGCSIPGTDNGDADGSNNQAGLWAATGLNYVIGNRFAGSFNGMFYSFNTGGSGNADGKVDPYRGGLGRLQGNTFHNHGRFGTYILFNFPKKCYPDLDNYGYLTGTCSAWTSTGEDNGLSLQVFENLDYGNAFNWGYTVGDLQYKKHISINSLNLIYWKETKPFADGCSSHLTNGYYSGGNMALPGGEGALILENVTFWGPTTLETNHHCNVGVTGGLCMPMYVFSNVEWHSYGRRYWVSWLEGALYGGIFVLAPPEESNPTGERGFFPPGYCSLVSSVHTSLLSLTIDGINVCARSSSLDYAFPNISGSVLHTLTNGGIFCKKPLRTFQVYSRGQKLTSYVNLTLTVKWSGNTQAIYTVPYLQIGSDGDSEKQGYAFPVIPGTDFTWNIKLANGSNIPSDWIMIFSDPVFGNRWRTDYLQLEAQGRNCPTTIDSYHDRRYVWGGSNGDDNLGSLAWGRGACTSYPSMAAVTCSDPSVYTEPAKSVCAPDSETCPGGCNNGWCDCATGKCVCDPGFSGTNCLLNECEAARCGEHGTCLIKYLGGEMTASAATCQCKDGYSGPLCDKKVCSDELDCNGHGKCVDLSDTSTGFKCICDGTYSGAFCNSSCVGYCSGGNGYIPFGCADPEVTPTAARYCGRTGGCSYPDLGTIVTGTSCCYSGCGNCAGTTCPPARNDCYWGGSCVESTKKCSSEVMRPDGSHCNSVPYGVCIQGQCVNIESSI